MEKLTEKELQLLLKEKKASKRGKKRMASGKKALFLSFMICAVLIVFTMLMIFAGKDTTSLTILASAGVGILPVMYGIYSNYETKINLMHMEKNYNPNYDEEEGIY